MIAMWQDGKRQDDGTIQWNNFQRINEAHMATGLFRWSIGQGEKILITKFQHRVQHTHTAERPFASLIVLGICVDKVGTLAVAVAPNGKELIGKFENFPTEYQTSDAVRH